MAKPGPPPKQVSKDLYRSVDPADSGPEYVSRRLADYREANPDLPAELSELLQLSSVAICRLLSDYRALARWADKVDQELLKIKKEGLHAQAV